MNRLLSGLFLVILLVVLVGCSSREEEYVIHTVATNLSPSFLYAREQSPIPDEYLVVRQPSGGEFNVSVFEFKSSDTPKGWQYFCKDTGQMAEYVTYFEYYNSSDKPSWYKRLAVVCGNVYIIGDYKNTVSGNITPVTDTYSVVNTDDPPYSIDPIARLYGPFNLT